MVRAEYKQSQIQAKIEKSDIAANEEERPPGEEEPADDGTDSVNTLSICDRGSAIFAHMDFSFCAFVEIKV